MSTLASVVLRDIAANRPAASIAGRLFFDTTNVKMQRDNGSSWDDVADSTTGDLAGKELDYVEKTSDTSITATSEATGITVVSGSSVAYDGATIVLIEFYSPQVSIVSTGAGICVIDLWEDSTAIGRLAVLATGATATDWRASVAASRRRTPSNASHTYHIKAWKTAAGPTVAVQAGAGGSGVLMPAFIRITRVSS